MPEVVLAPEKLLPYVRLHRERHVPHIEDLASPMMKNWRRNPLVARLA
jgi:hypothetical protein